MNNLSLLFFFIPLITFIINIFINNIIRRKSLRESFDIALLAFLIHEALLVAYFVLFR
jgi:uncharacterized membrane protein YoaK (UPF0700 family)